MNNTNKEVLKRKFLSETRELIFLTAYLALFLNSLTVYKSLLLDQDVLTFYHVGYNVVEAVLLAKIIMLGRLLKLGERYQNKPLIIPTVYKAAIFSVFVVAFTLAEHFILGYLKGKKFDLVWSEFTLHAMDETIGRLLIGFLMFILLFSFLGITEVFGEERVFNLFFKKRVSENQEK